VLPQENSQERGGVKNSCKGGNNPSTLDRGWGGGGGGGGWVVEGGGGGGGSRSSKSSLVTY
jgi:hypothetical protein